MFDAKLCARALDRRVVRWKEGWCIGCVGHLPDEPERLVLAGNFRRLGNAQLGTSVFPSARRPYWDGARPVIEVVNGDLCVVARIYIYCTYMLCLCFFVLSKPIR